jgi:hypothetical protein
MDPPFTQIRKSVHLHPSPASRSSTRGSISEHQLGYYHYQLASTVLIITFQKYKYITVLPWCNLRCIYPHKLSLLKSCFIRCQMTGGSGNSQEVVVANARNSECQEMMKGSELYHP